MTSGPRLAGTYQRIDDYNCEIYVLPWIGPEETLALCAVACNDASQEPFRNAFWMMQDALQLQSSSVVTDPVRPLGNVRCIQ